MAGLCVAILQGLPSTLDFIRPRLHKMTPNQFLKIHAFKITPFSYLSSCLRLGLVVTSSQNGQEQRC